MKQSAHIVLGVIILLANASGGGAQSANERLKRVSRFSSRTLTPDVGDDAAQRESSAQSGIDLRRGASGNGGDADKGPGTARQKAPKYEVGVHFTLLSVNPPTALCFPPCFIGSNRPSVNEPGFGGRFTYNVTDYLGLEAEANFFTRDHPTFTGPGGHMFQGQFGVKAGKRFHKWGVFGKARPGFMGFTNVIQLVSTHPQTFAGFQTVQGDFRLGKKLYFSTDVGGVVEFYISRRIMTRVDLSDTIVHYGEYAIAGFPVSAPILRRPPETHHNLQFTAGIGFRF